MELLTGKQKSEERPPDLSPVMCEKEQKVFHQLFLFFWLFFSPILLLPVRAAWTCQIHTIWALLVLVSGMHILKLTLLFLLFPGQAFRLPDASPDLSVDN